MFLRPSVLNGIVCAVSQKEKSIQMKIKKVCTLLAALALGQTVSVHAADVARYVVAKGQDYVQTNATTVVSITTNQPFRFSAMVDGIYNGSVLAAGLKLPNAQTRTLTNTGDGAFEFETGFPTKSALDAAYGVGSYAYTILGANDGTNRPALALAADNFPPVPKIFNWDDLQAVEAAQPLNFSWGAFTNGTTNDFIMVEVTTPDGTPVVSTPALFEADALNGKNLTAQIPAASLNDGTAYLGSLFFLKRTALATNYPGAKGAAGYFRETDFPLVTQPTPAAGGRIQFANTYFSAVENSGVANIVITRSGSTGPLSVDLGTQDGTAHAGQDYQGFFQTITFEDGQTVLTNAVTLYDNFLLDGNRTLRLALVNPPAGAEIGTRSNAVLVIFDDESAAAGKLQFAARSNSVPEAGKFAAVTVNRVGGTTGTVSVNFATADATAIAGQNYIATNGTLVFGPGVPSRTITIPILNDSIYEASEVFLVTLTGPTGGAAFGTNVTTKVGIVNDDLGGTFAFKQGGYIAYETATNFNVTVVRTGGAASGVTVDYATADGTAQAGVRYVPTSGTLTFGSNELSKSFQVGVINDAIPNGDQSFTVQLSNATGGAKIATNLLKAATLTVRDDESSISISNAVVSVSEGASSVLVTLVRSGALGTAVSVDFATADGSASAGSDYRATNGTANFPANVSTKTITIPIINDTIAEGNENFTFRISNPQGGVQTGSTTEQNITIVDNDVSGTIQFASAAITGYQGSNAVVRITRTGGLASGVAVPLTMGGGTASAGTDYTDASQLVTFNAGETNRTILIALPFNALNTTTRTVSLALGAPAGLGAALGANTAATLTINHQPDANAVPITGPVFMSGNFGSAAVNVTPNNLGNSVNGVHTAGFKLQVNFTTGASTSTVLNIFDFEGIPFATGTTTMDNSGNNGIMLYTKTGFTGSSQSWAVADGSAAVGSHGTVSIDAIDTGTKTVSGRFTFHAVGNTGTTPAVLDITNGKFRTHYP
jgi:hypothetical protein